MAKVRIEVGLTSKERAMGITGKRVVEWDEPPPIPTCQGLVNEAEARDCWLYDPTDKAWFTPQEFKQKHERFAHGFENLFKRIEIRNPVEAIEQAKDKMVQMLERHASFADRVVKYYNQRRKK